MTTTTPDTVGIPAADPRRPSTLRLRFGVAFLVGLLAGHGRRRRGPVRLRPAVHRPGAARRVASARSTCPVSTRPPPPSACAPPTATLGEGELVLSRAPDETAITYAEIGRGPDVEAMVAEALAVGRDGNADRAGHRRRPDGAPRRRRSSPASPSTRTPWPSAIVAYRRLAWRASRRTPRSPSIDEPSSSSCRPWTAAGRRGRCRSRRPSPTSASSTRPRRADLRGARRIVAPAITTDRGVDGQGRRRSGSPRRRSSSRSTGQEQSISRRPGCGRG